MISDEGSTMPICPARPDPVHVYPAHLRAQVEAAPRAPGVYMFYAKGDSIPLYIGKSIDIRSRLLAHLRTGLPLTQPQRELRDKLETLGFELELELELAADDGLPQATSDIELTQATRLLGHSTEK